MNILIAPQLLSILRSYYISNQTLKLAKIFLDTSLWMFTKISILVLILCSIHPACLIYVTKFNPTLLFHPALLFHPDWQLDVLEYSRNSLGIFYQTDNYLFSRIYTCDLKTMCCSQHQILWYQWTMAVNFMMSFIIHSYDSCRPRILKKITYR